MKSTGLASLALVATAATFFSSADAHGKMTVPAARKMSEKFHKDSGALINIGLSEMQIAPIEGLSQHKQADFPPSPTFNLLNGCRGTVYEEGMEATTIQPGSKFDVKWEIDAPHPGYMKLSILKPSEGTSGKITYTSYKTLLNVEPFAKNGGDGGTTATMPADVEGCDKPGACVLQFYWHSDIANQTYPTCADIVVSGSGGGNSTTTTTTTTSSLEMSTTGSSFESTPSTNATPSTNSSPSTNNTPSSNASPSTSTPSTTGSPSTNNTPSTDSSNPSPTTNNSPSGNSPSTVNTPPSSYTFNSPAASSPATTAPSSFTFDSVGGGANNMGTSRMRRR